MTYDNTDTNADGAIDAPIDNDSVSTGESVTNGGSVVVDAVNADDKFYREGFSSIQPAVDAMPLEGTDSFPRGEILIGAKGANGGQDYIYDENVTIPYKRLRIRGHNHNAKLQPWGGSSAPALKVEGTDDCQLINFWVDNPTDSTTDGDAIQAVDGTEIWIRGMNVDRAGRYAINLGSSNLMKRCWIGEWTEIKGGDKAAVRLNTIQSLISDTIIHDELSHGIPVGLVLDNFKNNIVSNLWICLDDGQAAIDWTNTGQGDGCIWNGVYIGKTRSDANGNIAEDVDLRGKNAIYNNFYIGTTGLNMQYATESIFNGYVSGSITHGTRTVINGKSINAGDPSTGGGQWAGFSDLAYKMGADVIDTSTEGDKYEPLPPSATNDWIRHSGTAV